MPSDTCPICLGTWGGKFNQSGTSFDGRSFDCEICGSYRASGSVLDDSDQLSNSRKMNDRTRASLAHFIRTSQTSANESPFITTYWLERFLENARLPTPGEQAINIIRFIGDYVEKNGVPMELFPAYFFAAVGSPNPGFAYSLTKELLDARLVSGTPFEAMGRTGQMKRANLTLQGWDRYEAEKTGKMAGSYGFIAMKFGDSELDPFVRSVVKPAVIELGYSLIDLRDAAQPGVIDNILREKIRDAAFILVDLTHDNSGAYWEAGFAEGLGKPVLYLCEWRKFDEKKTHFDTNHCTTVIWGGSKSNEDFAAELRATLRNSLKLFPRS